MSTPLVSDEHSLYEYGPGNVARWCAGDGSDETVAFRAAAEEARAGNRSLIMPAHLRLRVDGVVDLRYITTLDLQGIIRVGAEGRVDVGHSAYHRVGSQIRVHRVEQVSRSTQDNPVLRVVGMKQANIWIDFCDYVQFYANNRSVEDRSTAYLVVYPGFIRKMEFRCVNESPDESFAWISQITLVGGDIKNLVCASDSFRINCVTFLGTCLESGTITLDYANRWRFIDVRCEFGTTFKFGRNTSRIIVEDSFIGSEYSIGPTAVLVEDLGSENVLTTGMETQYQRRVLAAVDTDTAVLDGVAETGENLVPGVRFLTANSPGAVILDTGMIELSGGSADALYSNVASWRITRLYLSSDVAFMRPEWYFYDSTGHQITTPEGFTVDGSATWSTSGNHYYHSTTVAASGVSVREGADIAYIRCVVKAAPTIAPFSRLEVVGFFTGGSSDYMANRLGRRLTRSLTQVEKPRAGSLPVGTVANARGGEYRVVERRQHTCGAVLAGEDMVTISDGSGVAIGDVFGVEMVDGLTHWCEVAGISGSSLVRLSVKLPKDVSQTARSVSVRWEAW